MTTRVNKAVAPYYDDYDSTKQYTQLLAVPGRVAQAREITQIQSVMRNLIKSLGDSILKDGNIIEGCQVIINSAKTAATITAGKVYIDGMVLPVSETTIAITGQGTETIGFKLVESLITESEDSTLKDPAQGYDNFGQAGCHRIKSSVTVVKDDPDAAILATLIDGAVTVEKYAPDYDNLTQTLARRTYDESGSYIVDGLSVRVESNTDNTKFNVVIESGKAYVLGYELKIPAARRLSLQRSLTTNTVSGVLLRYTSSLSSYELSNAPYVKQILQVKGPVSKTVNQTISSNVDRVLLDELEGISITSVTQGSSTFTVGSSTSGDCYLQREGTRYYLKWNGTSNYPTLNSTYAVVYSYSRTFVYGTDYTLYHNTTTDGDEIKWLSGGSTPLNNTDFSVNYEQYLARKDTIYMDQYGNISAVLGTPAEYGFEVAPEAPVNTLPLASVMSPPGGAISSNANIQISVNNTGLNRFTMNDIQKLLSRIRTLEYDQAVLSLNEEAKQYETTNSKRGIFTDPLIDFSKLDYYYNKSNGTRVDSDLPVYDASIDMTDNICYLPVVSNTYDLTYDSNSSTNKYNRIATLAKVGEQVVLSQLNATKSFLINPYSMFPQSPEVSISPAVDTWIEDTIVEVPVSVSSSEVISSSTRHTESTRYSGGSFDTYRTTSSSTSTTVVGNKVSTSATESIVDQKAITYIRTREIEVEGSQFPANLDNIKCYFDGVSCSMTPTGSTQSGTATGSVKANSAGSFTAKFTIPQNILTGVREVRFESNTTIDGYEGSAFALYQASGTSRTIQRTVTTTTTVLLHSVTTVNTTTHIDPVGQTFVLDKMTMVTGVDLYFEAKPTGTTPVTCEIREVVNGTITSTVYGHKTLNANSVNISSDGSSATRFTLEDPVLLEANTEYAFVVRSTSPSYRLWVAELGGTDVSTGQPVLSNPYLIGNMLSSSNNSSWTVHQTTDVKFRLIADTYSQTATILFNNLSPTAAFSRIYLSAESLIPDGTKIDWFYSKDSGSTYLPINTYNLTLLDSMQDTIKIKANLSRDTNSSLSPILAIDSVGLGLSNYDLTGWYISKNVSGLDAYTHVDVVLDSYIPSNTAMEVYVSTGGSLVRANIVNNMSKNLNYGWKEQTYSATVSSATQCRVYIKMTSTYKYFTPSFRRLRVIMS